VVDWFLQLLQNPCLVLNEGETIYPHPLPNPTDPNIPKDLARDLDEAKMCFSVNCYRACAVMAQRCIQNACLQKGVAAKDLVDQIAELEQKGIITKDIREWATVVRWVGNDAAHPGKDDVKKEDAKDCLDLAEQFLHVIFVTPAVAKARRTARGK
jgi:HEPN domain-containing protein